MSTDFACKNVFIKYLIGLLLILIGDVEQNTGLEKDKSHKTFCLRSLNGLMAHNFIKDPSLETLAVTNDYDISCFIETFLDSSIDNGYDKMFIPRCNLLHVEHPNIKWNDQC